MYFIPGYAIAVLTFPGVIIHELAHQLFCRLFRIPVYSVCYFRLGDPTGYVVHGRTANWRQCFLISTGPFFLNSILGAFLSFPSTLRASAFVGSASIIDVVLIWFGVSVAMHAIPSKGDAYAMRQAVAGTNASFLAKLIVAPIYFVILVLATGSVLWFDFLYGCAVCLALPNLLVWMLA